MPGEGYKCWVELPVLGIRLAVGSNSGHSFIWEVSSQVVVQIKGKEKWQLQQQPLDLEQSLLAG